MLDLLIYFIVAVIIFAVLYWVVNSLLPEPVRRIANIVLVVIAAVFICYLLLGMVHGGGSLSAPRLSR